MDELKVLAAAIIPMSSKSAVKHVVQTDSQGLRRTLLYCTIVLASFTEIGQLHPR
jgi:hypothetical protein